MKKHSFRTLIMTDEQFETYSKLLQLVEELIEEMPDEKKSEF